MLARDGLPAGPSEPAATRRSPSPESVPRAGPSRLSSTPITHKQQVIGCRHRANNALAASAAHRGLPDAAAKMAAAVAHWRRADPCQQRRQTPPLPPPPSGGPRLGDKCGSVPAGAPFSALSPRVVGKMRVACRPALVARCAAARARGAEAGRRRGASFCAGPVGRYRCTIELSRVCSMSYRDAELGSYSAELIFLIQNMFEANTPS